MAELVLVAVVLVLLAVAYRVVARQESARTGAARLPPPPGSDRPEARLPADDPRVDGGPEPSA